MSLDLICKVQDARKYFGHKPEYADILSELERLVHDDDVVNLRKTLAKLPSEEDLLKKLYNEVLRSKSVGKTLKRVAMGKVENKLEEMKGFFSLGTHLTIEIEKGNREYIKLVRSVYSKLGELVYNV